MKEKEKDLVFCENCKWLKTKEKSACGHACAHPKNLKITWLRMEPNNPPTFLNQKNNCEWFEKDPPLHGTCLPEGSV